MSWTKDGAKGREKDRGMNRTMAEIKDITADKTENKTVTNWHWSGSLTIEAALGLTIFMFTVICLIIPMKMLDTQRQVQTVLEAASRQMSQFAYIRYRLSQGDQDIKNQDQEIPEEIASLFTGTAASVYLSSKIKEAAGEKKIEKLDFTRLHISEDGEKIDLEVHYRLRLPFSIFSLDSVPAVSGSYRRGWIGSEGGRSKDGGSENDTEDKTVYVGSSMGRYHWSKNCHYISNNIISVSGEDIKDYKSISGTHYKKCSRCGGGSSGQTSVYVMPNGEYYHSSKDCSSIAYYVREVPLSEVEYLGECSYCRRMKGQ